MPTKSSRKHRTYGRPLTVRLPPGLDQYMREAAAREETGEAEYVRDLIRADRRQWRQQEQAQHQPTATAA